MTPLLSRAQMRAFDRYAIESCHVPGAILMENAGRGAAEVASRILASRPHGVAGARVVVVAGAGNNGGDGFVVARHLMARGANVRVFLAALPDRVLGDARVHHDAFVGLGGVCVVLPPGSDLAPLDDALARADLVIDALFGTGLDRRIEAPLARVIDAMNRAPGRRLALDVPSGLDADSGAPLGACVEAHDTVTFGHLKLGLLTPRGARLAGRIHLADLGVPSALDDVGMAVGTALGELGPVAEVVERRDVARLLRPRETDAHKFAVGGVLVLAGSAGKSGAALMCARGALRAGAGLVTVATWPEAHAVIDARVPEVMAIALDRAAPLSAVDEALRGRRAVVAGPGFGLDHAAGEVVEHVLEAFEGTVVLDADALTQFRGRPEALAGARAKLVLTPHSGELGRLLGLSAEDVERDRFGSVRTLVEATHAVVVLKGARTIVAAPWPERAARDGEERIRIVVSAAGNPVLAAAGSGDVLAGVIGALACGLHPFDAAMSGVHVHGLAGDVLRASVGDRGVFASEVADAVPRVLDALLRDVAIPGVPEESFAR